MSNISSVNSANNPYFTNPGTPSQSTLKDFNAIGTALQSGDLSSAASALSAFQQDFAGGSSATTNSPFGKNSKANKDYQSLTSAIKSGDTAAAQKAFASLKADLKTTQKTHHHHHHSGSAPASAATSASAATTGSTTTNNGQGVNTVA